MVSVNMKNSTMNIVFVAISLIRVDFIIETKLHKTLTIHNNFTESIYHGLRLNQEGNRL